MLWTVKASTAKSFAPFSNGECEGIFSHSFFFASVQQHESYPALSMLFDANPYILK
jgi:hypothetical protein